MSTDAQSEDMCNLPARRRHRAYEEAIVAVRIELGRELFGDELAAISTTVSSVFDVLERDTERIYLCPQCNTEVVRVGDKVSCPTHGAIHGYSLRRGLWHGDVRLAVIFTPLP